MLWNAGSVVDGRRKMGDIFGDWVFRTDRAGIYAVAFAGLGHGIVARVEVFAVLEVLREVVGSGREFTI